MTQTLKLEIVTPAGTVYSEDVEMVTLPSIAGQMGILPRHVPLIAQMVPGEMIVRKDGRDVFVATGEGLIEVTGNRVAILTDLAVPACSWGWNANESARPGCCSAAYEPLR